MNVCLMSGRTFLTDLAGEHSPIPFQHIPRAVQTLLLPGVCSIKSSHIRSELSAEESAMVSTNTSTNRKQLLLSWGLVRLTAPRPGP